jgi:filamentous hemagglutinin family protein
MAVHHKRYITKNYKRLLFPFLPILCVSCLVLTSAWAEVTLDGTLGRSGALSGPNYRITADLGRQAGSNLFHSFGKFNVYTGESATFTGPSSITNIISRVTGGSSSWIDGRLRSEITGANLYLINPSGVMFGPNASLDISGSFHVTTADYLKLGQEGRFYATTPEKSVLTSASPSAFGFLGSNPGSISFDGTVLEVPSGKTISVIGGDIQMKNSSLHAQGGRINLASAASAGEVSPGDTGLLMEGFTKQGNITVSRSTAFTNYADIDVGAAKAGQDGGAVYIRGGRFEMRGGTILADTMSSRNGGGVDIRVTEAMIQDSAGIQDGGLILSRTNGAGKAGDVIIEARSLELTNGGYIDTSTWANGRGGNISISAGESVLISGARGSDYSGLYAKTYYSGDGGHIYLSTPSMTITEQGKISVKSFWGGNAGNIDLSVGSLSISGGGAISSDALDIGRGGQVHITASGPVTISGKKGSSRSQISSSAEYDGEGGSITISTPALSLDNEGTIVSQNSGQGNGGNITLGVGTLTIKGGSSINAGTFGEGNCGHININASESITVSGKVGRASSGVYANSFASGRGGDIFISSKELVMDDGAYMSTGTMGYGDAGNVRFDVRSLTMNGGSQVTTDALSLGTGRGGNIVVNASESISISGQKYGNQTGLYTNTSSKGNAGSITIVTPSLFMDQDGVLSSKTGSTANAGAIRVDVGSLSINGGASIGTESIFGGQGGDITINASQSVNISGKSSSAPSGLFASTLYGGAGGNINISVPYLLVDQEGQIQSRSMQGGDAGQIRINVNNLSLTGGGAISVSTWGSGRGGDITVNATDSVRISGNSGDFVSGIVSNSMQGTGNAGKIMIYAPTMIIDGGKVSASTVEDGRGGDILLGVSNLVVANGGMVDTSSSGAGDGGTINLQVSNLQIVNNASVSAKSSGTGKGGDITVHATDSILLSNGSSITTETLNADGGNIDMSAHNLLGLSNSYITTSVQGGLGNGGNISIDPRFVTLNGSSIIANAYGGNGGNISIISDYLLSSPDSKVQASSQLGISGTINITAPDIDLTGSLTVLPSNYLDAVSLMRDRCEALSDEKASSLVVIGRGGMPIEPDDFLPSP